HERGGAARGQAFHGRQREAAIGRGLAGRDAKSFRQVSEDPLGAVQRARYVAADLEVTVADWTAAELSIEAQHLLDLDARHAEIVDEPRDVVIVDIAPILLDAPQAREDERGLEARGIARLELLEFGNEMLHAGLSDRTRRRSC